MRQPLRQDSLQFPHREPGWRQILRDLAARELKFPRIGCTIRSVFGSQARAGGPRDQGTVHLARVWVPPIEPAAPGRGREARLLALPRARDTSNMQPEAVPDQSAVVSGHAPVTAFICANSARPGLTPSSGIRPRPAAPSLNWPFAVQEILVPCTGEGGYPGRQDTHFIDTIEGRALCHYALAAASRQFRTSSGLRATGYRHSPYRPSAFTALMTHRSAAARLR